MESIPTEIIAILIGIFLLFFGYRVKKIALTIIWFVVGYYLVSKFVDKITADQLWQFILCCVGGLILGMFGMTIERFAIFVTVGVAFGLAVMQNFSLSNEWLTIAVAVAVGVVAGVIAVWLIKPMIIFATSIEGASLVLANAFSLLNIIRPDWYFILFLATAAFGAVFQWNNCLNIE